MGYIVERFPEHPAARGQNSIVMQHRLVAEQLLGRYLTGAEVVHHEDRVRWNNDPSNLWLFRNHAEHMRHHKKGEKRYQADLAERLRCLAPAKSLSAKEVAAQLGCSVNTMKALAKEHDIQWVSRAESGLSEESAREALQGRSTLEAASTLGVSHQTLRSLFPHLLSKRASPDFLDAHREEIRSLATRERNAELADRFGCHPMTLNKAIARWSSEEPDAWLGVIAFRRSRLGMKWSRVRKP
jgi:DNA-binding CsgD family transcriptional regulator